MLKPKYKSYPYPNALKAKIIFGLLCNNLLISIVIGVVVGFLISTLDLEVGDNDIEQMLKRYSPSLVLLLAVIIAPVLEETIFRGPLSFFKKSKHFAKALYVSVFLFGFIHLFNYSSFENVLWIAPLLFLPQLITGVFLSYVRIRMGLAYSILYHSLFNLVIIGPFLLTQPLKTP